MSLRHSPLAFVENKDAPVKLIEVTSDGHARRLEVTEDLIERYIEMDFSTHGSRNELPASVETIKLFWSRRVGEYNGNMTPVPLSSHAFGRIAPFARIPEIYARVLDYKAATYVFANPQLHLHLARTSPKDARSRYLSFILQSVPGAASDVYVTASFTYDFSTRHMYIFMHGLATHNYDRFASAIQQGAASNSAFLIPSIIVQFNLERAVQALNSWHDKIYWHERKLGIRFDHHDNPPLSSIDFSKLSKDINAANTNLARIALSCKSITRMLDFLDQVAKRYRHQADANKIAEDESTEVEQLLLDTHAHMRSWNAGLEDRTEYLSKRGQALVQTVYSGIAQRDSAISLRLASTSASLARSSQSVAISTSRDSKLMKTIAGVTMFFLPATFTATFFSTTFFDFKPEQDDRVYSQWLWLYFVVTIILNLIVFFGTWYLWRKKELDSIASDLFSNKDQEAQAVEQPGNGPDHEVVHYVEQEIDHGALGASLRTNSEYTQPNRRQKRYAQTEASA